VFAVPMIALYLVSIGIAWIAGRSTRGEVSRDSALLKLLLAATIVRRRIGRAAVAAGIVALALIAAPGLSAQTSAVAYDNARLIIGDEQAPIEIGALVVQNGRITALGAKGRVTAPAGAAHVDLAGRTVMPTMINVHVHIGYEGYTSWGAEHYT